MNCGYGGNWSDKSESDFIEVIDNKDAKINELLLKVKKSDETVRQMRYWAKKIRETI
jgi:SPX domain protein involved in polyphosphate accumulation